MATTLSLSSPLFLAAPPKARDVISLGVASAAPSRSTANLPCRGYFPGLAHGRKQQRHTSVVSVFGRKTKITRETVVPDPDYRLPIAILGIAGAFAYADNLLTAAPVGLLGLLLLFQTTRVRFVFDDEALEVKVGNKLQESGENVFVGGKNRWKYSNIRELGTVVATIPYPGLLQRDPNETRRPNSFLPCDFQRPATL
ncbi:hypothetical protein ACQ4PT_055271 [Festuca glaucescens]